MNVEEYMRSRGIGEGDLDRIAEPYERGDYPSDGGTVYVGSHIDAVGKRRVTVVYDARDTQKVAAIARGRGVKPSEIYREALGFYLAAQS